MHFEDTGKLLSGQTLSAYESSPVENCLPWIGLQTCTDAVIAAPALELTRGEVPQLWSVDRNNFG